jgi:hypothetical protein
MRKEVVNKSNRKEISEYERSGSLLVGIMMGLFYREDNLNNTSLNCKGKMAMKKLIRFYTLVAILATTLMLNLGAPRKAEAYYYYPVVYSYYVNLYDYYANYYTTAAKYGSPSYWTTAQTYAYYAYYYAYNYVYYYAPSGSYTNTYAYYSYYYAYLRYQYPYYDAYDYYFDYYRGLTLYYATLES